MCKKENKMANIVEYKYYSDDSIARYLGKLTYHKYDVINILSNDSVSSTDWYKQKQKIWRYVFECEKNNTNKNIFYLYFYERKKQAEIAYLCEVTQAYVAKSLKKMVIKLDNYFKQGQLFLPFEYN